MDKEEAKIAGWGRRFTFGKHPDGSIGSVANPTALSSCMTSEKGPLDTRFKHCDTTKVFSFLYHASYKHRNTLYKFKNMK